MGFPLQRFFVSIIAVALFWPGVPAVAQSQPSGAVSAMLLKAERDLDQGRTTLDLQTLAAARNDFSACVKADSRSATCYYGIARTYLYAAQAQNFAHQAGAAGVSIDNAISNAQKAAALDDRLADAHALLADLYGQKITGAFSAMRYGSKANAENARALEIDPNNAQAYAVTGRKYFYSPAMFGGSLDKAIDSFRRATVLDPRCDEDFVWLAIACRKKGDSRCAQNALAQALRLNSDSVFARYVQSGEFR